MTWIAACNGQRGIYQETMMTDEERWQLCEALRQLLNPPVNCLKAADEIERLAEERDQFVEQLAIRSESGMAKDMQEIMRINNEQADEIKRLAALVDDYKLVFGDIHKTELEEMKARIEAYDRGAP